MQQHLPVAPSPPGSRSSSKRSISNISRGSAAYSRKRAVTACQVCRARRTKCDQKKPSCSFCESIGAECNSDPASQSTFDPASIAIIERLDHLQRKLDTISQVSLLDSTLSSSAKTVPAYHPRPLGNFLPENLTAIVKWPVFQSLNLPLVPTPNQCTPSISEELHLAACNQWLDAFFRHDHCKNPVLDEQSTRRLVRRICQEGVGWDSESCLVLLVCANGALASPLSSRSVSANEITLSIPNSFFMAAMKRLGPALGTAGVVQAQCLFLAGMFLMSTLRPFDAWRMFLQALAICQGFSCYNELDPESDSGSKSSNEAEGSIYWSAWKSEREVRWELGLPDFRDMGLDAPRAFPSCSKSYEGDNLRAWYFYLSEISLWRLETAAKNEIRTLVTESPAQVDLEVLAEMAKENVQQITAWQNSLPANLSIAESDLPTGDAGDILRFVLRGRTTYFHEMISWPFIYAVLNEQEDAPRVRHWAAKGFAFHLERLNINRPGYYHRHHGTWLMIRSSARSACILLAGAQSSFTAELLPPNWQDAVEAAISMLRFWSHDCEGLAVTVDLLTCLLSNVYDR
ncbi:hypothetical protein B0J14DRAFT_613334 [Halenospora varia]|nr:hypothetical protein B0J14DRAFT_613334 [Halenospora varia]